MLLLFLVFDAPNKNQMHRSVMIIILHLILEILMSLIETVLKPSKNVNLVRIYY